MTKRVRKKPTTNKRARNASAPRPVGVVPSEVNEAPAAYDQGYADAVMLRAHSFRQGMTNAVLKFGNGGTRASAYVWGFWHAIATGATKRRANPHPKYEETHGGLAGDFETKSMRVPDPRVGPIVVMGRAVRLEYVTDKGDTETTYFHDFGREVVGGRERGRVAASRQPLVVFNREGLMFAGGNYRVRAEGIVG